MELTQEEIKIIRKALQIVRMAHMVIETDDGKDDRDTKLDAILKRFRNAEEGLPMINAKYCDPDKDREYLKHF